MRARGAPVRLGMPAPYLAQIAAQLGAMGVDVSAWLLHAGIAPAPIEAIAESLTVEAFERLVTGAVALAREPAFGLLVGQRLQLGTHGVLGYAAQSSGSIRQALGLFEAFVRTRFPLIAIAVERGPSETRVAIAPLGRLGAASQVVIEAIVAATKNVLDAIAMGSAAVRAVSFAFAEPTYAGFARELFGCRVRYGASWSGLVLEARALDVPLRAADPAAFAEAVRICERELERIATTDTFAGRVRRVLLEQPSGLPSLPVTARMLHMTPRTLHRRLVDEGTSFRAILEDVRRTLACEQMKSGRFALQEIAHRLGYTDFANFRRAFKRWEGVAPSTYAARVRDARG